MWGTDFGGEAAICRFRWFPVDKRYSLVTSGSSAWVGRSVPAHGLRTGFVRARTWQVISWADHTSCHPPPLGTRSPGAARWVSPEPLGPPSTGSLGLLHGHGSPRKRGGSVESVTPGAMIRRGTRSRRQVMCPIWCRLSDVMARPPSEDPQKPLARGLGPAHEAGSRVPIVFSRFL